MSGGWARWVQPADFVAHEGSTIMAITAAFVRDWGPAGIGNHIRGGGIRSQRSEPLRLKVT